MRRPDLRLVAVAAAALLLGSPTVAEPASAANLRPPSRVPATAGAPISSGVPTQVVVYDRQAGTTALVSHDQRGAPGSQSSRWPSVSADGSFVAFESDAALLSTDQNGQADVYRWSRTNDQSTQVSVGATGGQPDGASRRPSISGDGHLVTFSTNATNLSLDQGLSPNVSQVFVRDLDLGRSTLVSVGIDGAGFGASRNPVISGDGRVVAFESDAFNLVTDDTNAATDVFLRDLRRAVTIRASLSSTGRQVGVASHRPSLSGVGGTVAFDSAASTLVAKDANTARDVFVRDLPPAISVAPNPVDFGIVALGTPATLGVTVTGIGWTPAGITDAILGGANAGDFALAGDGCANQTLDQGVTCSVGVLFIPTASGARSGTLSIPSSAAGSPAVVTLLGGVGPPALHFDPPIGPPGIVTIVTGSGFPPGGLVVPHWDLGLNQTMAPVTVGPDGTFVVQVLVYRNDIIGPRNLVASASSGGPTFGDVTGLFLVVPRSLQPPGTGALTFLSPELELQPVSR